MTNAITSLTSLAVSLFRERQEESYRAPEWLGFIPVYDPVLRRAQQETFILPERHSGLAEVSREVFADSDLTPLASSEGQLDPMVLHGGGGMRMSPDAMTMGLFSAALLKIHYFRLPNEEGAFVRLVLEGFEELKRAARGEHVRTYTLSGVACVTLPQGRKVSTPWGDLYPAVPANDITHMEFVFRHPSATCVLAQPRLTRIHFDRSAETNFTPDSSEEPAAPVRILFPLACALASPDPAKPVVPVLTWSTDLLPFQAGFAYSYPFLPPILRPATDLAPISEGLEEWARVVHNCHSPSVEIAASRLALAASHRLDRADALIDAVMAWENLVGTTTEVTFRVTAALAKLLESDPAARRSLRKSLANVYDTRSRVVHGGAVDQSDLESAAAEAIAVAVRSLKISYRRGREWLSLTSQERADRLLLEEP